MVGRGVSRPGAVCAPGLFDQRVRHGGRPLPPRVVGTAIGIAAFAGNLAGLAMIEAAGWSLDKGFGYGPMLFICAGSYLIGLGLVQVLVPRLTVADPSTPRLQVAYH